MARRGDGIYQRGRTWWACVPEAEAWLRRHLEGLDN